jgi:hypothetical protein
MDSCNPNFNWLISAIVLIFFFNTALHGQHEKRMQDQSNHYIIYLEDGSILQGELINWEQNGNLELRLPNGNMIKLDAEQVKKVVDSQVKRKVLEEYVFEEKGFYSLLRFQLIAPNGGDRGGDKPGAGVNFSYGYQFNQFLGLGLGLGYHRYIFDTGEDIVPVFADIIGYISKSNTSPFYHVSVGYGIGITNEDYDIIEADGGLYLHPSIGIRWGTKKIKWLVDIGYIFQNAAFTYGNEFDPRNRTIQDLTYKRLTAGLSLYF